MPSLRAAAAATLVLLPANLARASPRAATTEDLVEVRGANVLSHGTVSARLVTGYGERLDDRARSAQGGALLRRSVHSEAAFAVGLFDALQLEAALPVILLQQGTGTSADGAPPPSLAPSGLGDLWFGLAATPLPLPARGVGLGLAFDVVAPTATVQPATYDRGFRYFPQILFSARKGRVEFHAAAGYLVRPHTRVGQVVVDDQVTYGLGTRVPLGPRKAAAFVAETTGAVSVNRAGADPLRVRGGVEIRTRAGPTLLFGIFGAPLVGPGDPSVGATFAVGYAPPERVGRSRSLERVPRPATPALVARYRALVPARHASAGSPGGLGDDPDGDRILAERDACPQIPEDRDGFLDEDGCPDDDDDRDGLADAVDACPREPEVRNGFADDDGCPDVRTARGGVHLRRFDPDAALPVLAFDAQATDASPALRRSVARLAELLRVNPWIERIEVEVRVQGTAPDEALQRRAALRAELLVHLLAREGIDRARVRVLPAKKVPAGHPVRVRLGVVRARPLPARRRTDTKLAAGPYGGGDGVP